MNVLLAALLLASAGAAAAASNAPAGYPSKSPEGYDLFYPIGGDGLPAGAPRLIHDGQTFASAAEIEDYKRRVPVRRANLERWQASVDTPGVGFPVFTPQQTSAILAAFDREPRLEIRWYMLTTPEHYALQNRGWKRDDVNRMINRYNMGGTPDGWMGSELQRLRDPRTNSWDPQAQAKRREAEALMKSLLANPARAAAPTRVKTGG